MFDSLVKIVTAPVRIVDATVLRPVAEIADEVAKEIEDTLR